MKGKHRTKRMHPTTMITIVTQIFKPVLKKNSVEKPYLHGDCHCIN